MQHRQIKWRRSQTAMPSDERTNDLINWQTRLTTNNVEELSHQLSNYAFVSSGIIALDHSRRYRVCSRPPVSQSDGPSDLQRDPSYPSLRCDPSIDTAGPPSHGPSVGRFRASPHHPSVKFRRSLAPKIPRGERANRALRGALASIVPVARVGRDSAPTRPAR